MRRKLLKSPKSKSGANRCIRNLWHRLLVLTDQHHSLSNTSQQRFVPLPHVTAFFPGTTVQLFCSLSVWDRGCIWNRPLCPQIVRTVISSGVRNSIPQCTAKTNVQPMYTQWLENPHNALWESHAEWIPASRQKMAHAAESSIHLV